MADGNQTGLMPRSTIAQLVGARLQAAQAFATAWEALEAAQKLAKTAAPSARFDLPWIAGGSCYGNQTVSFNTADAYRAYVEKGLNRSVWDHVIRSTNLDQLMDRHEREAFQAQLRDSPPEATVENIAATVERLLGDSDLIFKRGIANIFSKLDRRFRSHDGFKIGARLVLSCAISDFGTWNHYAGHDDNLVDIERTFAILDRQPQPTRDAGIVGAINAGRGRGLSRQAYEVSSPYFRAKMFKNGNVHLWFERDDLVERVNLLLAEYYGANLGVAPDVAEKTHAHAVTPAKDFGLFPSPPEVVARVIEQAKVWTRETYRGDYPKLRVLEPSAGPGAIASPAAAAGHAVTCVEVQPHLAHALAASGRYAKVLSEDFLTIRPAGLGAPFDRIIMNPPFDRGRDIDHVTHALQFLADDGILVSVMSAGTEFREDSKATAFRAMVERRGGYFVDLPAGSFAASGTYVNTILCVIGRKKF